MSNPIKGLNSSNPFYLEAYGQGTAEYSNWEQGYGETGYSTPDQYFPNQASAGMQNPTTGYTDGMGEWDSEQAPPPSEGEEFKQQCTALISLIQDDTNLSAEQKQQYAEQITKLQGGADLHPDSLDLYQEQLDNLREGYSTAAEHSPLANELAARYGQDAATIEEIANKHGLDLRNLPQPTNEAVLKFVAELDPSLAEGLTTAKKAVEDKLKKDGEMMQKAKDRNTLATMSNKDLDDTDLSAYEYLLQAQTGADSASLDMKDKLAAFQSQVASALGALYGEGSASLDPALLAGAYDLNIPSLPDEAPELVPMAWDGRGTKNGGNFDKMEWPAWVSDYPKIEYNGEAKD